MGELDLFVPPATAGFTPQHIPKCQIEVHKNASHWMWVEIPDIISARLNKWIEEEVYPTEDKNDSK